MSISKKHYLRQGDVKNSFFSGILPEDETIICITPKDCPLSKPNTYWELKKTLLYYGLATSPRHWFHIIKKTFHLWDFPTTPIVPVFSLAPHMPTTHPSTLASMLTTFVISVRMTSLQNSIKTLLSTYNSKTYWYPPIRLSDTIWCFWLTPACFRYIHAPVQWMGGITLVCSKIYSLILVMPMQYNYFKLLRQTHWSTIWLAQTRIFVFPPYHWYWRTTVLLFCMYAYSLQQLIWL